MKGTPVSDGPDDNLHRAPNGGPIIEGTVVRDADPAETERADRPPPRYWRGGHWQQPPPRRRRSGPITWVLPGLAGIVALAALWLALQWLFPAPEPAPVDTAPQVAATAVGAIAPPDSQPATPPMGAQTTAPIEPTAQVGDSMPGLTTGAATPVAPTADPRQDVPPADPKPELATAPATDPPETAPPAEASAPEENAAPASGAAAASGEAPVAPQAEASAERLAPPAAAPPSVPAAIPTRETAPAAPARAVAPPPAPAPAAPPPRAVAQPPGPARGAGGLQLRVSASPTNPVSERAFVTVTASMTNNGAPVAGALCLATVTFRTATVRQPEGGARTGSNGVATFTVDGKGATYNVFVPVDVTCTSAAGSVSARTGFTPVRGR